MAVDTLAKLSRMRVDHVGSLLRPEDLKAMFQRHAEGKASGEELRRAQDAAIRDVVAQQEAHGLPVVTGNTAALTGRSAFRMLKAGTSGHARGRGSAASRAIAGPTSSHYSAAKMPW